MPYRFWGLLDSCLAADDFMTQLGQFSGPMMSPSAGFHANDTGWIVGKKRQQFTAFEFLF